MSLQLVEGMCSSLTADIIDKLTNSNIKTVAEYCAFDHSKLRFVSRVSSIDYEKLVKLREELLTKFGSKPKNMYKLFNRQLKNLVTFNTGTNGMNKLLDNGIYSHEITEICGHSSAGKTQFCYSFATTLLKTTENKSVLFIDTDLSFSFERILAIIAERHPDVYKSSPELTLLLSKFKVCRIFDIFTLLDFFDHMSSDLCSNRESVFKNIGVIIIDSLSTPMCLGVQKLSSAIDQCNDEKMRIKLKCRTASLISQVGNILHLFALKYAVAIVVTNSLAFQLKHNWKNYCAVSLLIEKEENDTNLRRITVTQSNRLSKNDVYSANFLIKTSGVRSQDSQDDCVVVVTEQNTR